MNSDEYCSSNANEPIALNKEILTLTEHDTFHSEVTLTFKRLDIIVNSNKEGVGWNNIRKSFEQFSSVITLEDLSLIIEIYPDSFILQYRESEFDEYELFLSIKNNSSNLKNDRLIKFR